MTLAEVGDLIGKTESSVSRYETQDHRLTLPLMRQLAKLYGSTVGEIADETAPVQEIAIRDLGDEYVKIAGFDIRFAAGSGTLETSDARTGFHIFRHEWLRKITNAPSEMLVVVMVDGDSMRQTLHHGDHVLVDRTVTSIGRDGIYILRSGDELQVKRVQLQPDNLLTIKSDNPDYEIFRNVAVEDVEILGRVIWLGRPV